MFDGKIENAIADFAMMLEAHDNGALLLDGHPDFDNLSEVEKRELGSVISRILVGFLCSAEETKAKLYIVGATDGILPSEVIDGFHNLRFSERDLSKKGSLTS